MYKGKHNEIYIYFQDVKRIKYFMIYCEKIGIENISQLTPEIIDYTRRLAGVGADSYEKIVEKFEEITKYNLNGKNVYATGLLNIEKCFKGLATSEKFIELCNSKGINLIGEITPGVFDEFLVQKGVRITAYNKIRERYDEILTDENNIEILDIPSNTFDFICEENNNIKLNYIYELDDYSEILDKLKDKQITTIGDLKQQPLKEIIRILGTKGFIALKCSLHSLKEEYLGSVIKAFLRDIKEIKFDILCDRANGVSYTNISKLHNLSGERIRQIEVIYLDRISNKVETIIELIISNEDIDFFRGSKISEYIKNEEFNKVWRYVLIKSKKYVYIEFADKFVKKNKINIIDCLNTILTNITGELCSSKDTIQYIDKALRGYHITCFEIVDIESYLKLNGYEIYGDYLMKKGKSYGILCREIVKEYFPSGIDVSSDTDIMFLRDQLRIKFNWCGLNRKDMAIVTIMVRELILAGRSKYMAPENVIIDRKILDSITNYINKKQESKIYYFEIYKKFEKSLSKKTNINNSQFLHGVIKYYFSKEYSFSRDYLIKKTKRIS